MKNKLLSTLALLVFCLPAFSQTPDSVSYKNQIGIIASPSLQYLFQNRELPVGLIYKRQVKQDQALRVSVLGRYTKRGNPLYQGSNSSYVALNHTNYFAQVLLGYEWQKELSQRWIFYYGMDAGVGYSKGDSDHDFKNYSPAQNGSVSFIHLNYSSQYYVFRPMAGIRFNLSSRLYLASETTIALHYSRHQNKQIETSYTSGETPKTNEVDKSNNNSTSLQYLPLSNIQLVYKF